MRDKKSSKSLKGTTSINDLQKQINALSAKSSTGSSSADLTDEKHGGDGISIASGKISADVDGTGLEIKSDKIVIKDGGVSLQHLNTSSFGTGLVIDSGKINVELVHQPFVGGAAAVLVGGTTRSAYSSGSALRSGSNWNFYTAKPLQISILNFGGVYKVSLRGELEVRVGIPAHNFNSLQWEDILHYFGDATSSSLINTIGTSSLLRPYGPESQIWMPVTRRLTSTGNYDAINGEVHTLEAGTHESKTYFMRFSQSLNPDDRVVLDSVFYWAVPT
jgi:hypothetical protein